MDNNGKSKYHAAEQFCAAAEREYEYELGRNSSLDNKISMTLAFCGVVFAFLLNYLDFSTLCSPSNLPHVCTTSLCAECSIRIICIILQLLCLVAFAICIGMLFSIVNPKQYCRLDPDFLLQETLPEWEPCQAYMYLGVRYKEISDFNYHVNEKRSKRYGLAIIFLVSSTVLFILNETIKTNFLSITR